MAREKTLHSPMRTKLALSLILIVFTGLLAWLAIPPYAEAASYVHDPYQVLNKKLGKPDVFIDGKYYGWKANRLIGGWELRAGFSDPPAQSTTPSSVERVLWLGLPFGITLKLFSDEADVTPAAPMA